MNRINKIALLSVTVTLLNLFGIAQKAQAQVSGVAPQTFWREVDQSLPGGLWRIYFNNGTFNLQYNTDATGAFGTTTTVMSVTGGVATFNGALFTSGEIKDSAGADASPYTQARLTLYNDGSNWAYLGYGSDAQMRVVYSTTASAQSMLFGTTSAANNTGTFTTTAKLTATGVFQVGDGTAATPSVSFINSTGLGFYRGGSNFMEIVSSGAVVAEVGPTYLQMTTGATTGWADVVLGRDAANVLALKNGTAAQELRVYGTTTGPIYTRISNDGTSGHIETNANGLFVGPVGDAATNFQINGATRWQITSSASSYTILPSNDNTYDLCTSGNRCRSAYIGTSLNMGTTPATTGIIALPNNTFINARNAANSANLAILGLDNADNVVMAASANFNFTVGGSVRVAIDNGELYPVVGTQNLGTTFLKWAKLYVNSPIITQSTPADNATCEAGQIYVDTGFVYVCTASGTVKRAALSTY